MTIEQPSVASGKPATPWLNKVPEITLAFWIIKILSTTVGETGADFLAVDVGMGLLLTLALMAGLLSASLFLQLRTRRHTPWTYWLTVVLVSIVGTQVTDLLTDALGVPLTISTPLFAVALSTVFLVWYRREHQLSIHQINTRRRELFYWAAILCTFALGTAAGDLASETLAFGFGGAAAAYGALIAITFLAWRMGANAVGTFWIGYILTRPLGAALGDLLTQPREAGGIGASLAWISMLFLVAIVVLVTRAQWRALHELRPALLGVPKPTNMP